MLHLLWLFTVQYTELDAHCPCTGVSTLAAPSCNYWEGTCWRQCWLVWKAQERRPWLVWPGRGWRGWAASWLCSTSQRCQHPHCDAATAVTRRHAPVTCHVSRHAHTTAGTTSAWRARITLFIEFERHRYASIPSTSSTSLLTVSF